MQCIAQKTAYDYKQKRLTKLKLKKNWKYFDSDTMKFLFLLQSTFYTSSVVFNQIYAIINHINLCSSKLTTERSFPVPELIHKISEWKNAKICKLMKINGEFLFLYFPPLILQWLQLVFHLISMHLFLQLLFPTNSFKITFFFKIFSKNIYHFCTCDGR